MRPTDTIRCLFRTFLSGCFALLLLTGSALAQNNPPPVDNAPYYQYYRADGTWFVRGLLGLNFYGGDRDINVRNELQKFVENIGPAFSLEGGYSFTNRFSLSLQYFWGRYPRIKDDIGEDGPYERPAYGVIDDATTSKVRHHFSLVGRSYLLPNKRVTPYGHLGFHVSFGKINDDLRIGVGPMTGIGLDAAVSDRVGIYMELDGIFAFNDRALDFADTRSKQTPDAPEGIDASDFDAFTFLGVGVRVNFGGIPLPPIVDCIGPMHPETPGRVPPNQQVPFTATANENATLPITWTWNFDDGTPEFVAADESLVSRVEHAFAPRDPEYKGDPVYYVTVTATNRGGSDTRMCPVLVPPPPLTCNIISAEPSTLSMCQPLPLVQFSSDVTYGAGAEPITYSWNFGDGDTSSENINTSHQYVRTDAEPTTLTRIATLTVTDAFNTTAQCSLPIDIEPCVLCEFLYEIYFEYNDSALDDDDRRALGQNLPVLFTFLRDYPDEQIVIRGEALPNERYAERLAEARARAIRDFYIELSREQYPDASLDASRFVLESIVKEVLPKQGTVRGRTYCPGEER